MVQREVGDRLFARPAPRPTARSPSSCSSSTVRTGSHPVSREVFRPRPNVDSALVAFRRVEPGVPEGVKRVVVGAFAHRRKTLANSLSLAGLASREQAAAALEAIDRDPATAPRRSTRPSSSRSHTRCGDDRSRPREDQPRAGRRARAAPTATTRSRPCSSASSSATRSRSSRATRSPSRASPRTRSCAARSSSSRLRPASSRAGASGSRSGSRSPQASAAAAPTRPRRSASPTDARRAASSRATLTRSRGPSAPTSRSSSAGAEARNGRRRRRSSRSRSRRTTRSCCSCLTGREGVHRRRLRPLRRRRGLRRTRARRVSSDRPRTTAARPRRAAAERPRLLAARRRALAAGAFRADVSGAGPTLYGLFPDRAAAERAAAELASLGRVWVADPAW